LPITFLQDIKMNKKTLAILGLGSQTTLHYISELNRMFNLKHGGYSTCPFILLNANFDAINSLLPNTSKELSRLTQVCIQDIEKLDTAHILVPNITLHETIDQLSVKKNILHPIHLTASKIKVQQHAKVILMGSEYTMNSAYIRAIFSSKGIDIEIPTAEDRLQIDVFRRQVYSKQETKAQIENYHNIIKKYTAKNPVVLACTELSILKPKDNNKLFDMVDIQITAAINTL